MKINIIILISILAFQAPAKGLERSGFVVDPLSDGAVILGTGTLALLEELALPDLVKPWCALDCDPDRVNALDATIIGNHSTAARTTSDILVSGMMGLPFVLGLVDQLVSTTENGWGDYGRDVVVMAQVLAVNLAITNTLKIAIKRPRPLVYSDSWTEEERLEGDAGVSFPSGHTSTSFAMATAYSRVFQLRHPESPLVVPVWLGSYALAGFTGYLRTAAGKHFWTDVGAGALIGIGVGFLVTSLHEELGNSRLGSALLPEPMVYQDGDQWIYGLSTGVISF